MKQFWIVFFILLSGNILSQYVVTNTSNFGAGSLRDGVENSGASTITFSPFLAGSTIIINSSLTANNFSLIIDASSLATPVIIKGSSNTFTFLEASSTNSLILKNIKVEYFNRGIDNIKDLDLDAVTFENINSSAIRNTSGNSNLILKNCNFYSNSSNVIFYQNSNTIITIDNCVFNANAASTILNLSNVSVNSGITIKSSVFKNNTVSNVLNFANNYNLVVEKSSFINNTGRVLNIEDSGSAKITNTTFSNNNATETIRINTSGILEIVNATFKEPNNIIRIESTSSGSFKTRNTIYDAVGNNFNDLSSIAKTSLGGNISNDASMAAFFTNINDLSSTNPLLEVLTTSANPFFLNTHPLSDSSPAIDNGISTDAPNTDQLDQTRVGNLDSGSVESEVLNLTLSGGKNINCPEDVLLTSDTSATGKNYFLRNNTTKEVIGNPQTGTASALNFQTGVVSETTDFHVFAANPSYALTFDGVDDTIEIPHDNSLNFSTGVTVEAWVHPTNITNGYQEIYRKEGADAVGRILFSFQNNGTILSFGTHTTTDAYTELDVAINPTDYNNQWVHVLAFFDDATNAMRIYRNGVEIGNKASNGTLVNSANPQAGYIGSWNGTSEYFQGKIASLRIWDKALTTQQEINLAKNNLFVGDEPNLVAYYPFFENAGSQLTDVTTNANNGTISGATWSSGTTGGVGKVASNAQTITVNLPNVIYVDKSATGSNNGSSWANAYTSIQPAVTAAVENQEIRIAQGTYSITNQINITKALLIKGGYAMGGSCTQDIANNPTIIDAYEFANVNKQRVINATHTSGTLFIEGVTLQNGDTVNSTFGGGGIATVGNLHLSFATIKNCITRAGVNSFGGAIYSLIGNITLSNSQVSNNFSNSIGGGIYTKSGSVTLTNNSQVSHNTSSSSSSSSGGGIYTESGSVTLTNSQVSNNISSSSSSSYGGGIFTNSGNITLTNSLVSSNTSSSSSSRGGGIYTSDGLITLTNSQVSNNSSSSSSSSSSYGGGIRGTTILQNSILWDNTKSTDGGATFTPSEHEIGTLTANYSLIKNQNPAGTANIDATIGGFNPFFVNEAGGDYRLQNGSPLINIGNNSYNTTTTDLDNNARFIGTIDIGAYEFNGATNANTSWTGATNTLWQEPTNWNNGVPNANSNVIIPTGLGNYPTVTNLNNATAFNVDNNSGGNLTINAGKGLTIGNNLTNNGTVTVNSDATSSGALVVQGTASGNITYNRYVTDNWHTIGAPVIGQNMHEFAVTNNATNQVIQNGDNSKYAIAPYNNDISTNNWEYVLASDITTAGDFTNGKGYSMKRALAGTYSFTGNIENNNKTVTLTEGSKNNWNLIANPYPSFLKFNNLADASSNLLLQNVAELNPSNLAVYIWDTTTSGYKPYNHASTNLQYLAPGQAFFVNAKTGGSSFTFYKSMQTHYTGAVFAKNANSIFEMSLQISDGKKTKSTQIKYLKNTTKGLDMGYDAAQFSAENNSFSIFTELLENNENKVFALQCLPPTGFEEQIIPIGVNADANSSISFSVDAKNIPKGIHIYLEDKLENTFTKLNDDGNYEITLLEAQNGVGRFYVHTTSQVLSTDDVSSTLDISKIWVSENRTLHISNIPERKSTLKIYDVLGQEVLTRFLYSTRNKSKVQLPKSLLQTIYLVRLETKKGVVTKKIIVR